MIGQYLTYSIALIIIIIIIIRGAYQAQQKISQQTSQCAKNKGIWEIFSEMVYFPLKKYCRTDKQSICLTLSNKLT